VAVIDTTLRSRSKYSLLLRLAVTGGNTGVRPIKELAKENRDLNTRNKEFEERLKALEDLEKKK